MESAPKYRSAIADLTHLLFQGELTTDIIATLQHFCIARWLSGRTLDLRLTGRWLLLLLLLLQNLYSAQIQACSNRRRPVRFHIT